MSEQAEWVEIMWISRNFILVLKVSTFYLEKQKSFIKKKMFLDCCQYQNKTALFTDPILREGFGFDFLDLSWFDFDFILQTVTHALKESVEMKCAAVAIPSPKVYWTKK